MGCFCLFRGDSRTCLTRPSWQLWSLRTPNPKSAAFCCRRHDKKKKRIGEGGGGPGGDY